MNYVVTIISLDSGVCVSRHDFYDDAMSQLTLASKTGNAAMGFMAQFPEDTPMGVVISSFGLESAGLDNLVKMA